MSITGKKIALLIIQAVLLFSIPLSGQIKMADDTIHIREVVISGKVNGLVHTGFKRTEINQSLLIDSRQKNLADVISENSFIFIKSYGPGGTATTSIRGAGASQTQVTWNDININTPMPGQSDLSLIPSTFIDNVQIYYGGSSMALASGVIGGIINLETKPVWKKESSLILNPGFGSFGRYTGSFQVKSGNDHFQTVTRAYLESAENNFSYINDVISAEPLKETRRNSEMRQYGFLQEFYYKNTNSISSARIWYQAAQRNLPSPMSVQQVLSGESQDDKALRTMLNHVAYRGNFKYSFTGAAILNRLDYFNRNLSIDSKNLSGKFVFKTGLETSLKNDYTIKASFNNELSVIESNNYNGRASRNVINITASVEKRNERWGTSLLIRELIHDDVFLIPDFTAGLEFRITENRGHFIKGNFSKNSKIPDMNDIFWVPGGNPELRNEYGLSGELIYQAVEKISGEMDVLFDITFFRNSMRDMIQWHPGRFSYWTADNIERVNTMGTETSAALVWTRNEFSGRLNVRCSVTSASTAGETDASVRKQLIYVPGIRSHAGLSVSYKKINASWLTDHTGKIFITSDNSDYLPPVVLNNLKAGYKIDFKGSSLDLHLDINNLFNVSYQVIAMHPMPGRYYSFGILYNIVK